MKYIFLLLMFASSLVLAEQKPRNLAPYDGINSFSDALLNGQTQQLMPQYCVFWSPGQGGICQIFFDNIERNLTAGGSAKQAYCQNMQLAMQTPPECPPGNYTPQQCQISQEYFLNQIRQNLSRYCSN